ncbi:MAG: hypothetical protein ACXABY_08155 [Candidatus Thorarchaeota archaeon]|jgi:hypothetical protein
MANLSNYNQREEAAVAQEVAVYATADYTADAATFAPHETEIMLVGGVAVTLTAPHWSLCVGKGMYNIMFQVDAGQVTVAFPNGPDGASDPADVVLTAVGDYVNCYATNERWVVESSVAT